MEQKYIIIAIIIIVAILFLYNKQENLDIITLSNEAIQNIASVYNNQNMTVTNLNVTAWKGIIVAYNGTTPPNGWAVCDGTQGTPDLRGRFIRSSYTMTGANNGDLNGDNVPINISDPNATLNNIFSRDDPTVLYGKMQQHKFGEFGGTDWRQQGRYEVGRHNHPSYAGYPANPNNSIGYVPINNTGIAAPSDGGWNFETVASMGIMPPYYVLTYIMKL